MYTFKTRFIAVGMVAILLTGFAATRPTQEKENTLTPDEKKAGWVLLFDGKSTNGWRAYNNQPFDSWEVVNGELHCKESGVQHRADLVTAGQYGNFELTFDWKVGK